MNLNQTSEKNLKRLFEIIKELCPLPKGAQAITFTSNTAIFAQKYFLKIFHLRFENARGGQTSPSPYPQGNLHAWSLATRKFSGSENYRVTERVSRDKHKTTESPDRTRNFTEFGNRIQDFRDSSRQFLIIATVYCFNFLLFPATSHDQLNNITANCEIFVMVAV